MIVRKLAEQIVNKDEFLTKIDAVLKLIAEQSQSEEDLKKNINKIIMLKPSFMGLRIDFNELYERACHWWRNR